MLVALVLVVARPQFQLLLLVRVVVAGSRRPVLVGALVPFLSFALQVIVIIRARFADA